MSYCPWIVICLLSLYCWFWFYMWVIVIICKCMILFESLLLMYFQDPWMICSNKYWRTWYCIVVPSNNKCYNCVYLINISSSVDKVCKLSSVYIPTNAYRNQQSSWTRKAARHPGDTQTLTGNFCAGAATGGGGVRVQISKLSLNFARPCP